jgi:hypothetical protein
MKPLLSAHDLQEMEREGLGIKQMEWARNEMHSLFLNRAIEKPKSFTTDRVVIAEYDFLPPSQGILSILIMLLQLTARV